jgi:hypothetical protein
MSLRSASGEHSAGFGPTALARLGALLLLLALLPLHVLAPFLHAHTEADPRATMQAGLHLPGLEALEDEALDGPACGLRHPPLIEEADLCRRHADTDADEAMGPARDLRLIAAVPHIVPAADGVAPPEQPPPAPPARAPPSVSVDA